MILKYKSGQIIAKLDHSVKILVDAVSFTLRDGETLAMIGETGSGKTMIAMSIMHLLPENVTAEQEEVVFCEKKLDSAKSAQTLLGVDIIYIPQNGLEFLNPSRTVKHHLYDSLKKLGVPPKKRKQIAIEKLEAVGFEHPQEILDQYPFQLSGGMAQRVTIAIGACSRAKLVIADEPTNGLDNQAKVRFMEMLNILFPDAAKLIITHDIAIARLCDRALVLCRGNMMEIGCADEIFSAPHHPYTRALLSALVENGMHETPILRQAEGNCPFYRRCWQAQKGCERQYHQSQTAEWWCSQ